MDCGKPAMSRAGTWRSQPLSRRDPGGRLNVVTPFHHLSGDSHLHPLARCRRPITASKKRRVYTPRIVGDKVMMPANLERLHKYMLEIEHIDHISDEMRAVVEDLWAELAHKLPPKPG